MDYQDAIGHLLSLVDHERSVPALPRQKRIYDLGNVLRLLDRLGNPHHRSGIVHIAGTKGKGSTAAMVESILRAAGYSTGFYSSPHLHTFRERIRIDGDPVSACRFAHLTASVWPYHLANADDPEAGPATLFEYLTAMAFCCFSAEHTDFSVIEVGLGGRLDATNVVAPAVSVITPVSLDHTAILGDTIGEIAADKAGIIKPGIPVVVAPQFPDAAAAIRCAAAAQSAPLVAVDDAVSWHTDAITEVGQKLTIRTQRDTYRPVLPLIGDFQVVNAAVAVTAVETLIADGREISKDAILNGLASVEWPARLEILARGPLVVADGAHNDHSMSTVLETLNTGLPHQRLTVIAGFSRDKRVSAMVELLARRADRVIATRSRHPRSMRPSEIVGQFLTAGLTTGSVNVKESVADAVDAAVSDAKSDELILVTGSLFVAAEAREAILGIPPETYPDLLPPDLR
jgi:dihydrofolate synthase/folylpolyglutamate synthase